MNPLKLERRIEIAQERKYNAHIHLRTLLRSAKSSPVRTTNVLWFIIKNWIGLDAMPAVGTLRINQDAVIIMSPDATLVIAHGSSNHPLELFHRTKEGKIRTKHVNMDKHCWLLPRESPMRDHVGFDVFCVISAFLSGWDVMSLRMVCKTFANFCARNAVWARRMSKIRAAVPQCPASLFSEIPLWRQFTHFALCFNFDPKDPRKRYLESAKDGVGSIMRDPKYLPLLEFAVKQVDRRFRVRMIPTQEGKNRETKKRAREPKRIFCSRKVKGSAQNVTFYPVFAAGVPTVDRYSCMYPRLWMSKGGSTFLQNDDNKRGRKRGRLEPFFEPFLRTMERF